MSETETVVSAMLLPDGHFRIRLEGNPATVRMASESIARSFEVLYRSREYKNREDAGVRVYFMCKPKELG